MMRPESALRREAEDDAVHGPMRVQASMAMAASGTMGREADHVAAL